MLSARLRPVLVLRPEPGNTMTCRRADAHGLHAHGAPLFAYVPQRWTLPEAGWDGLLIGSASVFAQGGPQLAALQDIPVHAVGPTTARAAQNAGFCVAATGSGGLQPLVTALPPGRYLRLAGVAHVALDLPPHVEVETRVVYDAKGLPLSPHAVDLIAREPVVALLHSAEAARRFAEQCDVLNLPRNRIALACLAPRIAVAAGSGWASVATAPRSDDEALLPLARQMCQTV